MNNEYSVAAHYLETVRKEFRKLKSQADASIAQLNDDDLNYTLDQEIQFDCDDNEASCGKYAFTVDGYLHDRRGESRPKSR